MGHKSQFLTVRCEECGNQKVIILPDSTEKQENLIDRKIQKKLATENTNDLLLLEVLALSKIHLELLSEIEKSD